MEPAGSTALEVVIRLGPVLQVAKSRCLQDRLCLVRFCLTGSPSNSILSAQPEVSMTAFCLHNCTVAIYFRKLRATQQQFIFANDLLAMTNVFE